VKFRFRFQRNADLKPISAIAAVYSNGEGTPRLSAVHHLNDDAQESQNKVFKPLETQWFEGAGMFQLSSILRVRQVVRLTDNNLSS
jgi:hypothetical protein